jgi:adenosylmethionine-8-amino-7-oxononanoate aminotransferase
LQKPQTQHNIERIHQAHLAFQASINNHPKVATTRVLGVIFALQIKTESQEEYYGTLRNKLYQFFIANGIILRPVGGIIYILPPYIITDQQLQKVYKTIQKALEIV